MKKFLKVFNTEEEYLEYTASTEFNLNSVSRCREGRLVFFNPADCGGYVPPTPPPTPSNWDITAKFNVTNTNNPTRIAKGTSNFSKIEIDGVEQTSVTTGYTFSTTGVHTVRYSLIDNTSIGEFAFQDCTGLTSIDIPDSVTSIGNSAFNNCYNLTSCTIGSGVTSIGSSAFRECTSLTSITIPDSVTSIDYQTFYNCYSLTSITIHDGVTSISDRAFYNCYSLTSIDIPDSVTSIGVGAVAYCSGLTNITINAIVPPTLNDYSIFTHTNNCPIYVPCESVDAYKAANIWSIYASRIQAIPGSCHDYVEIGGVKWATMNLGASSITDRGLYFAWGETSGYTASQVGTGSGMKTCGWNEYKYGGSDAGGQTKYNETDSLITLEPSDDAVQVMWGGGWRMPTNSEYQSLIDATNKTWMSNYNGSGNNGTLFTDKQDSSKTLFFPAAGYCQEVGNVYEVNRNGSYWSSTHKTEGEPNSRASYRLSIRDGECGMGGGKRANGLTVRGVFPY